MSRKGGLLQDVVSAVSNISYGDGDFGRQEILPELEVPLQTQTIVDGHLSFEGTRLEGSLGLLYTR